MVSREDIEVCPHCGGEVEQDPDVLDTWFSSALWPFSTMGWPDRTPELARYYPTSVLVTGYDIIFFWVARMMFTGIEFMKEVPFRHYSFMDWSATQRGAKCPSLWVMELIRWT